MCFHHTSSSLFLSLSFTHNAHTHASEKIQNFQLKNYVANTRAKYHRTDKRTRKMRVQWSLLMNKEPKDDAHRLVRFSCFDSANEDFSRLSRFASTSRPASGELPFSQYATRAETPEAEIAELCTDISQYTRDERKNDCVFSPNDYLDAHIHDSNIMCTYFAIHTHTHAHASSEMTLDSTCDAISKYVKHTRRTRLSLGHAYNKLKININLLSSLSRVSCYHNALSDTLHVTLHWIGWSYTH